MTSILDRLGEFQRAFERAEEEWIRWRNGPPHGAGFSPEQGPPLLEKMLAAMEAYRSYAESQTRQKLDNAARSRLKVVGAAPPSDADASIVLYLPSYLKRPLD